MAERVLMGTTENITYKEAEQMAENAMTELLFYIVGMVDDLTEDEEERADAKVNLGKMVGKVANGYLLAGILKDPKEYIEETFPEGSDVRIC